MALFVLCAGIDGPLARRLDVIHDGGFALYYSVQVVDSLRRIYAFHDSKLKERRKAGDMEVALPGSLRQRGVSAGLRTL